MTIKFNLENEADLQKFRRFSKTDNYTAVIYEWQNYLRNIWKYHEEEVFDKNELYDEWIAILNEYSVDPYRE